jgi:hypothetical protein
MKISTLLTVALFGGLTSLNALAADEITEQEAKDKGYKKIATLHITSKTASPMETKAMLSQRTEEKGGKYFVVVDGPEHHEHSATAEVYE